MGNSSVKPSETVLLRNKQISVKEEIIKRKNKTKTGFVLIIAMCCSTVINNMEPEEKSRTNEEIDSEPKIQRTSQNLAPKKPLNSRPRVRSYGYRFTRVSPLILSVDDLEDFPRPEGTVGDQEELSKIQVIVSPEEQDDKSELELPEEKGNKG